MDGCSFIGLLRRKVAHEDRGSAVTYFKLTHYPTPSRLDSCGQVHVNEPLHNDYVAPDAVEFSMLLVDADLTKAQRADQCPAGLVFGKNARNQLPVTGLLGAFDQRRQRNAAHATATRRPSNVDGDFGDSRVAFPAPVSRRRGERDDGIALLHDDDGVHTIEPGAHILQ